METAYPGELPESINTLEQEKFTKTKDNKTSVRVTVVDAAPAAGIVIKGHYNQTANGKLTKPAGTLTKAFGSIGGDDEVWYTIDGSAPAINVGHLGKRSGIIELENLEEIDNFDVVGDTTVGIYWTFWGNA